VALQYAADSHTVGISISSIQNSLSWPFWQQKSVCDGLPECLPRNEGLSMRSNKWKFDAHALWDFAFECKFLSDIELSIFRQLLKFHWR